jgi:hypothetical protein
MSSESDSAPAGFGAPTNSGPKPLPSYQNAMNRLIRGLLRTPLISRGIGSRLLTFSIVGRKSGKTYVIPVAYTRHEDSLLVGTVARKWLRNLTPGEPVEVRVRGKKRLADQVVFTDEANVMRLFDVIARDNRTNASFNGIGFDPDGSPNRADLHQAWQQGGAVIELRLRD